MSRDEWVWLGQRATDASATRAPGVEDPMERVHREFDQRKLRHAVDLILASSDAEEIVKELQWRLARRGRSSA